MLPTLSELTAEPIRGDTDGISMLPTLLGHLEKQRKHDYLYWELYEGVPNQAVRMGKWKGVVVDRRKGQEIELYDLYADGGEQRNVADEYPEVVERIRNTMNAAHVPSPFWSKDNRPLFNAPAACEATGATYVPPKPKIRNPRTAGKNNSRGL